MRVALFYMPFGVVEYPHLGTGMLKACLQREGHVCDVRNETLRFARVIGPDAYSYIEGNASPMLLGDRVFAKHLNPGIPDLERFFREVVRPAVRGVDNPLVFSHEAYLHWSRRMSEAETKAGDWLDDVVADPELARYDLFGFSTSYEQNAASLALAKKLRERHPETPIIFGGSNCMGFLGLGLLRAFPFIDYVFTGESEKTLVQFLRWCEDPGRHELPDRGVVSRAALDSGNYELDPDLECDLDSMPMPDYDDYFEELRKDDGWRKRFFGLAVEGSRGCWKAHGCHCIFCGLNGNQNRYRSKGTARFVEELEHLCDRHQARYVVSNDNILSPGLLSGAFPKLRESRPYSAMWQQIRVGMSRADLELLRDAGVRYIGAGLESLSTRLLEIMRKGLPAHDATALENVHLLKMATELGIDLTWQILCGFPGETAEDYDRMASLMGCLHHLVPPRQIVRISIERHSPLYAEAESFGMALEPSKAYRYVYDLPAERIAELAYCYQDRNLYGDRMASMGAPSYAEPVKQQIRLWQEEWPESKLGYTADEDGIVVVDGRDGSTQDRRHSGITRAVIESAMTPCTRRTIQEQVERQHPEAGRPEVDQAIAALLEQRHIVEDSGQYLFLGVEYRVRGERLSRDTDNFFLRAVRENRRYEYDH